MNLITPKGIRASLVVIVAHVIKMISAIRLQDGGAAILAAHMTNQSIDMVGMAIFRPLFIKSLREFDIE